MHAARLHEVGQPFQIDQVAIPEPGPRDVLADPTLITWGSGAAPTVEEALTPDSAQDAGVVACRLSTWHDARP